MDELNDGDSIKLDALKKEWSSTLESSIKKRLKSINYRIDYDTLSAVAGSERVEEVCLFCSFSTSCIHLLPDYHGFIVATRLTSCYTVCERPY